MEHFFQTIQGYSFLSDQGKLLEIILNEVDKSNLKIAEIGVFKGRMTAMWNVELINQNLKYDYYAIDHFKGSDEHEKGIDYYGITVDNLQNIRDNIHLIQNDSNDEVKNFPNRYFDIVYIDGCHDYQSIKRDIKNWYPKVKVGGIICGDDYVGDWPDVMKVVNERFINYEINHVGLQQWWVKKIIIDLL